MRPEDEWMGYGIPGGENMNQRYGMGDEKSYCVALRLPPVLLAVLSEILSFGLRYCLLSRFFVRIQILPFDWDMRGWIHYSVEVLVNQLFLTKKDWILAFVNFHDINTPTVADFKLPVQNRSWEATHLMDSLKAERADSSRPLDKLESQNIRGKRKLKRFKMDLDYTWGN